MSNADEILKLKELLDDKIITQEEFEKKKNELLNLNKINNINTTINNNGANDINTNVTKNRNIIKIFFIIFLILIIVMIITYNKVTIKASLKNKCGLSEEEAQAVENILNNCEIMIGELSENTEFDNVYIENSKGYTINIYNYCKILMILNNNQLYCLKMLEIDNKPVTEDKYLYNAGIQNATLSDYVILTTNSNDNNNISVLGNCASYPEVNKILTECGFYNYSLELCGEENGINYFIIRESNGKGYGLDIQNGIVISIDYNGNKLYENGQVIHRVDDFN